MLLFYKIPRIRFFFKQIDLFFAYWPRRIHGWVPTGEFYLGKLLSNSQFTIHNSQSSHPQICEFVWSSEITPN